MKFTPNRLPKPFERPGVDVSAGKTKREWIDLVIVQDLQRVDIGDTVVDLGLVVDRKIYTVKDSSWSTIELVFLSNTIKLFTYKDEREELFSKLKAFVKVQGD